MSIEITPSLETTNSEHRNYILENTEVLQCNAKCVALSSLMFAGASCVFASVVVGIPTFAAFMATRSKDVQEKFLMTTTLAVLSFAVCTFSSIASSKIIKETYPSSEAENRISVIDV
ncbi:MAG: hypothetical protein CMO81_00825 [Waddliaceae bacterium]|nr:hypothetical protein [Waddliaceae bacterium]